jgi:hypothetical protein
MKAYDFGLPCRLNVMSRNISILFLLTFSLWSFIWIPSLNQSKSSLSRLPASESDRLGQRGITETMASTSGLQAYKEANPIQFNLDASNLQDLEDFEQRVVHALGSSDPNALKIVAQKTNQFLRESLGYIKSDKLRKLIDIAQTYNIPVNNEELTGKNVFICEFANEVKDILKYRCPDPNNPYVPGGFDYDERLDGPKIKKVENYLEILSSFPVTYDGFDVKCEGKNFKEYFLAQIAESAEREKYSSRCYGNIDSQTFKESFLEKWNARNELEQNIIHKTPTKLASLTSSEGSIQELNGHIYKVETQTGNCDSKPDVSYLKVLIETIANSKDPKSNKIIESYEREGNGPLCPWITTFTYMGSIHSKTNPRKDNSPPNQRETR